MMMNKNNTVIYIGVTTDLISRIQSHVNNQYRTSFTSRYNIHKLVYYEILPSISDAIKREKCLKNWKREWKLDLIQSVNPEFEDLLPESLKNAQS